MIIRGKTKCLLENSIESALLAVETYNKPRSNFKLENYVVLMNIAWTKLFHAYFNLNGIKYFHRNKRGQYIKIDGERKTWDLSECMKNFSLSSAMEANIRMFIGIRNRIEHSYIDFADFDIFIFGECQALLYNYETILVKFFGEKYAINENLAYSLQFSTIRTERQINAQKKILSKEMVALKSYIEKYRSELSQEVFDSNEYSIKLIQLPKISNTNRNDLAIEFVRWDSLSEEDRALYSQVTAIIKDKIVVQNVVNLNLLKPGDVVKKVKEKGIEGFSTTANSILWKAFRIRPSNNADDKFETNQEYCLYDEAHNDFVYTDKWVDLIVKLFTKYGFTKGTLPSRCKWGLKIEEYK